MNTLPIGQPASLRGDSGAGAGLGTSAASPAHPLTVGAVGFGPMWEDQPTLRELYDQAVAGLVRAECEVEELRAEVAMLKEAMLLLAKERDEARFAARAGMTTDQMREDFMAKWRRDK
jgi:hypothetical protein